MDMLHHMGILRSQNKIPEFLMILAWASPFNYCINSRVILFILKLHWNRILPEGNKGWSSNP